MSEPENKQYSIAVLISGGGTNLQAIIDARRNGKLPARIAVVASNRNDPYGLTRARNAGIPTLVIDDTAYPDRDAYDKALISGLDDYQPDLIVLAGFMRILTAAFVERYRGRILNIHPALLPKYRGLDTYRRVLDAGDSVHGTSVHYVTEELDGGPVIMQAQVLIRESDDEYSLSARVQACEHIIYPEVIGWCATGRLAMPGNRVLVDGKPLESPVIRKHEALMKQ